MGLKSPDEGESMCVVDGQQGNISLSLIYSSFLLSAAAALIRFSDFHSLAAERFTSRSKRNLPKVEEVKALGGRAPESAVFRSSPPSLPAAL